MNLNGRPCHQTRLSRPINVRIFSPRDCIWPVSARLYSE